ncbi:hypothetical protein Pmani_040094 [Petrolisthes manimaculis]|uniref:Uncharacterized protein n=1 Tax=Petrolisthes manimaculis TaxID=1843537 RepID=A0AAE1NDY0_9EUCA|nr:hypothetical protein Pmani_040094 [Petrolisthes manimaculis]
MSKAFDLRKHRNVKSFHGSHEGKQCYQGDDILTPRWQQWNPRSRQGRVRVKIESGDDLAGDALSWGPRTLRRGGEQLPGPWKVINPRLHPPLPPFLATPTPSCTPLPPTTSHQGYNNNVPQFLTSYARCCLRDAVSLPGCSAYHLRH